MFKVNWVGDRNFSAFQTRRSRRKTDWSEMQREFCPVCQVPEENKLLPSFFSYLIPCLLKGESWASSVGVSCSYSLSWIFWVCDFSNLNLINIAMVIFLPFRLASRLRIWMWHPAFSFLTLSITWGNLPLIERVLYETLKSPSI